MLKKTIAEFYHFSGVVLSLLCIIQGQLSMLRDIYISLQALYFSSPGPFLFLETPLDQLLSLVSMFILMTYHHWISIVGKTDSTTPICFSQKEWESNEVCHYKSELYFRVTLLAVSSSDLPLAHWFASQFFVSSRVIIRQWSNRKHCNPLIFRKYELLAAGEDINPIKIKQHTSNFVSFDCHEVTPASHCREKIKVYT